MPLVGLQGLDGLEAIDSRHHHVEQDDVGLLPPGDLDDRLRPLLLGHLTPVLLEHKPQHLTNVRLVVDDENTPCHS